MPTPSWLTVMWFFLVSICMVLPHGVTNFPLTTCTWLAWWKCDSWLNFLKSYQFQFAKLGLAGPNSFPNMGVLEFGLVSVRLLKFLWFKPINSQAHCGVTLPTIVKYYRHRLLISVQSCGTQCLPFCGVQLLRTRMHCQAQSEMWLSVRVMWFYMPACTSFTLLRSLVPVGSATSTTFPSMA